LYLSVIIGFPTYILTRDISNREFVRDIDPDVSHFALYNIGKNGFMKVQKYNDVFDTAKKKPESPADHDINQQHKPIYEGSLRARTIKSDPRYVPFSLIADHLCTHELNTSLILGFHCKPLFEITGESTEILLSKGQLQEYDEFTLKNEERGRDIFNSFIDYCTSDKKILDDSKKPEYRQLISNLVDARELFSAKGPTDRGHTFNSQRMLGVGEHFSGGVACWENQPNGHEDKYPERWNRYESIKRHTQKLLITCESRYQRVLQKINTAFPDSLPEYLLLPIHPDTRLKSKVAAKKSKKIKKKYNRRKKPKSTKKIYKRNR
jgi:hypothetical protein